MKIHYLLVIREGEESQEDSLKIRSVEKFMEAWLWMFRSFLLDFCFSCELELSKCLNSQTCQTGWTTKSMCGRWNFDQKLKKLIGIHTMRFSCKIMKKHVSIDYENYFMGFRWKCVFCNPGWMSWSHGVRWKKSFEVCCKIALSWENKWEVLVFILIKSLLTWKLGWNGKSWKTQAKSSLLSKISSKTLTPMLLSLSPKLNGANEDNRVKIMGLYRRG